MRLLSLEIKACRRRELEAYLAKIVGQDNFLPDGVYFNGRDAAVQERAMCHYVFRTALNEDQRTKIEKQVKELGGRAISDLIPLFQPISQDYIDSLDGIPATKEKPGKTGRFEKLTGSRN